MQKGGLHSSPPRIRSNGAVLFDNRAAGELEGARPASNTIIRRLKSLIQAFQITAFCHKQNARRLKLFQKYLEKQKSGLHSSPPRARPAANAFLPVKALTPLDIFPFSLYPYAMDKRSDCLFLVRRKSVLN